MVDSLKASESGIKLINNAIEQVRSQEWWSLDDERWLDKASEFLPKVKNGKSLTSATVSISTWNRFRRGDLIKSPTFRAFCQVLNLNWEEVADQGCDSEMADESVFSQSESTTSLEDSKDSASNDSTEEDILGFQAKIEKRLRDEANVSQEKLFGVDEYLIRLKEYLRDQDSSWFISVAGAGGVGKTSLVEKLIREEAANAGFLDLAWVTAKRTYFRIESKSVEQNNSSVNIDALIDDIAYQLNLELPILLIERPKYLADFLRIKPYLIVIDNLEDLEDYSQLFNKFELKPNTQKSNFRPSKIIFTSRKKIKKLNIQITEEELAGINITATLEMIRYRGRSISCIRSASDEELQPIFIATNGVPLLILLVISMIRSSELTLDEIIDSLKEETDLCSYLYEETLFSLSESAQTIIMSMTEFSASNPVSRRKLRDTTRLDDQRFQQGVDECIQSSLLNSLRSLSGEPRYFIHNLLYEYLRGLGTDV